MTVKALFGLQIWVQSGERFSYAGNSKSFQVDGKHTECRMYDSQKRPVLLYLKQEK